MASGNSSFFFFQAQRHLNINWTANAYSPGLQFTPTREYCFKSSLVFAFLFTVHNAVCHICQMTHVSFTKILLASA